MNRFTFKEMKEFRALVEDKPENTTINEHHCKEGHGNDRCYITKKDGFVVAYCHHCHHRGSIRIDRAAYKRYASKGSVGALPPRSIELPADGQTTVLSWPPTAIAWLTKAKLSISDIEEMGAVYSPRYNRVFLPCSTPQGYMGYIARRLGDEGPKYLARYNDELNFVYHYNVAPGKRVVFTEDVLSAKRVSLAGYNAVPLLGTALTPAIKLLIVREGYNEFVLWLDNDNRQVKQNQAALMRELRTYGKVRIIKTDDDPKAYTPTQIIDEVDP